LIVFHVFLDLFVWIINAALGSIVLIVLRSRRTLHLLASKFGPVWQFILAAPFVLGSDPAKHNLKLDTQEAFGKCMLASIGKP